MGQNNRERLARPTNHQSPHIFIQNGWERMIIEASQAQDSEAFAIEVARWRAEGWKLTYSLNNTEGKTFYFKRALPRAPRLLKETLMW